MSKRMGRPCLFPGKDLKRFKKGHLTKVGTHAFKEAKKRLAVLSGWKVGAISDGDVIEYLSRGHLETVNYLAEQAWTE